MVLIQRSTLGVAKKPPPASLLLCNTVHQHAVVILAAVTCHELFSHHTNQLVTPSKCPTFNISSFAPHGFTFWSRLAKARLPAAQHIIALSHASPEHLGSLSFFVKLPSITTIHRYSCFARSFFEDIEDDEQ